MPYIVLRSYFHSCLVCGHLLVIPARNSQKLFEGKLVAHFLLDNSSKGFFSKGFDAEHWWEIDLVAFLTRSVI